ncbi:VOC family protein [Pedobacter flavus]|uniref:VOC family protein n=1 Tax=Pedobacter flavus TaxID=3113906 RepID=A0ABU7H2R9_9SPHI|nr:VOC family protein [Pedobacter sp. VNH31]MEE1885619.1 VOC family protein [Pedobacter sp. VNH31]
MESKILGLHHITAIANNAKVNHHFYTQVLGLRLVKKTVNFDDPGTYHFYFGNEKGEPGTILTFFPWEGIGKGRNGRGLATNITYSVPTGSLIFWTDRLKSFNIPSQIITNNFNENLLVFEDPDGLNLSFKEDNTDTRLPWKNKEIDEKALIYGFSGVTLTVKDLDPTAKILTDILDYEYVQDHVNEFRFKNKNITTANLVDIKLAPTPGYNAAGTNHHVAFRVKDEATLMHYREKVLAYGLDITPKIDRDYFFSLYFREPGGVLFEIATDNPGFDVDESVETLGTALKLPKRYESSRNEIVRILPEL